MLVLPYHAHCIKYIPTPSQRTHDFFSQTTDKKTAIYPLTERKIAEAQNKGRTLEKLTLLEKYKPQLIENIQVLCKDDKLVIPRELQKQSVEWYHHYL